VSEPEPVSFEMLRGILTKTRKPEPRAEFQEAMSGALAPLAPVLEALEDRLAAVEARTVEVLGLR